MIKQAPSLGRILAMAVFALSCFGILLFLWLSFGGTIPLKPQGYRFKAPFPEAATLAVEADVRLAGVNVGKVKTKELDKRGARTLVEIELEDEFAPIPRDSRAILRQKTLLGETYVEITQGTKAAGNLPDGGTLSRSNVEPTVELDEIFNAFDPPTRRAFRSWVKNAAEAIETNSPRTDEALNDAFGNLEGFAVDGTTLFKVLDEQEFAVRRLIRNTGRVFGAINEREGALRQLIVNSHNTFEATASRDEALAETIRIFPTFLDESRLTLARLERFARNTHPLVIDLKPVADDLGPTVRDLGDLAPDLERLFRDLGVSSPNLIDTSKTTLPAAQRFIDGAEPVFEALHTFLPELNPIFSLFNFEQGVITQFITEGGEALAGNARTETTQVTIPRNHYLPQVALIDGRSLARYVTRPSYDRGDSYINPNAYFRGVPLGAIESFDCKTAGIQRNPRENYPGNPANNDPSNTHAAPPCFPAPPSLFLGQQVPKLLPVDTFGETPIVPAPGNTLQSRGGLTEPCPNPDAQGLC
jgi:phospholipid/cholesterol/gamma-HCH transport system substrate-binding protein